MTAPEHQPSPRGPGDTTGARPSGPAALGAEPGLCGGCAHAAVNQTRRGTAYLRCLRAAWDERLPRYPRLPVRSCAGFEALTSSEHDR